MERLCKNKKDFYLLYNHLLHHLHQILIRFRLLQLLLNMILHLQYLLNKIHKKFLVL
jgi:hypothetical protein